eukprot:9293818-Pyramimonas_sp.AAC.1
MHPRGPGTCRYPHSAPIHWECPGCQQGKGRDRPMRAREFSKCRSAEPRALPRPCAGPRPRARPGGP